MGPVCTRGQFMSPTGQLLSDSAIENKGASLHPSANLWVQPRPSYGYSHIVVGVGVGGGGGGGVSGGSSGRFASACGVKLM